jgi:beta-xylosidase
MKKKFLYHFCFAICLFVLKPAQAQKLLEVTIAENDMGTYKNPVIHADYSDPDAIRVGDDYYMVASSFTHIPGLPILHSKDLVNWQLIGHALQKQPPYDVYDKVKHGAGVWAPSIRCHANEFYIFYPDPDYGIYVVKAKSINGPWSEPQLVEAGKGIIDPCPLWDDNGKVYLTYAYAGSRAGIKSILAVKELNSNVTKTTGNAVMVFDGHEKDATVEGPKFYKRNGYYYIFAPAGGVSTGWQLVLRSKNVFGPYERKVVLEQGASAVNGPHQGAWVTTQTGEDWFLHFQDKDAYGRIVHLQPMKWVNNWPVIGIDTDGNGVGEPVSVFKKPNTGNKTWSLKTMADTDEFNSTTLGLQWQWQANPQQSWAFTTPFGYYRMFAVYTPDSGSVFNYPNIIGQKFPAEEFTAAVKFSFHPNTPGERFALTILGLDYAYISVVKKADGNYISFASCKEADKNGKETVQDGKKLNNSEIYFRVAVTKGGACQFAFSENGNQFTDVGDKFTAKPGRWVGAKLGMFYTRNSKTNDGGFANVDWFKINK